MTDQEHPDHASLLTGCVFAKLGISSRTQLAADVARRGQDG
jgi:hypothetical protein